MATGVVYRNDIAYYGIASNKDCKNKVPYSMANIKTGFPCTYVDGNYYRVFVAPKDNIDEVSDDFGNVTETIDDVIYYRCITKKYLSDIGNNLLAVNSTSAYTNELIRYENISVDTTGEIILPWYDGNQKKYNLSEPAKKWTFKIFPSDNNDSTDYKDLALKHEHNNRDSGINIDPMPKITDFSVINNIIFSLPGRSTLTKTAIQVSTTFKQECNCQIIFDPVIKGVADTNYYYEFKYSSLNDDKSLNLFLNIPFLAFMRMFKNRHAAREYKPNKITVRVKADYQPWSNYIEATNKCSLGQ